MSLRPCRSLVRAALNSSRVQCNARVQSRSVHASAPRARANLTRPQRSRRCTVVNVATSSCNVARRWLSSSASAPKVPMDLLKQLRGETGAPLGDVKEALAQAFADHAEFDLSAARENLRKKGMATAAKRAGKEATEGLVGLSISDDSSLGLLVEVTAETDFVARSDQFKELVTTVTDALMHHVQQSKVDLTKETVNDVKTSGGASIGDAIADTVALLKENIVVRRFSILRASPGQGTVAGYMHNKVESARNSPTFSIGRHAALVALKTTDSANGAAFGEKLAMHIVAASPNYLSTAEVPEEVVEYERKMLKDEILTATPDKPDQVIEKIISGRINKYYGENVLLQQTYMLDDMDAGDDSKSKSSTVKSVLKNLSKSMASPVEIDTFARFHVGN